MHAPAVLDIDQQRWVALDEVGLNPGGSFHPLVAIGVERSVFAVLVDVVVLAVGFLDAASVRQSTDVARGVGLVKQERVALAVGGQNVERV